MKARLSARWKQIAFAGILFGAICIFFAVRNGAGSSTDVAARSRSTVVTNAPAAETGKASYYGFKYQGRPTASGEIFDINRLTAAHPTLKFGTRVRVTNLANSRWVIVRINDRGPFVEGRIIDLSQAAADELQMVQSGVVEVKVEVLSGMDAR
jgi:peptidoglycan lytic transglycosylase